MSDVVLVAIIAAIPGTVGAILGFINHGKLDTVKTEINGRMTELLKSSGDVRYNEGEQHEKDRVK